MGYSVLAMALCQYVNVVSFVLGYHVICNLCMGKLLHGRFVYIFKMLNYIPLICDVLMLLDGVSE